MIVLGSFRIDHAEQRAYSEESAKDSRLRLSERSRW